MSSDKHQTVAIATGATPAVLGGTVQAVVTITGDPDHKVRAATAQLVRTALHRYTNRDVVGYGSHDTLVHEHVVVTEAPIVPPGAAVAPGDHVVSLHVPEDGLPSATDQVQWSVRARIDRHLGADVEAEAPVEVLAGPERFAAEATGDARYKGERCIDLELSTRTLRPGETITGKVVLAPAQAVTVTVTNVLVLFVVTTPAKQGLEGAGVAARTLLDEPLELQPGETRSLGFELTLPQDAAPTVRGSLTTPPCHSVVSWDVGAEATAVVSGGGATERKGFVYLGVNVYNAVAAPAPPGGA